MHSTSTGALIFMLTCMYIPCPVHLCYSPVPSLGSVYSQLGQLLQQTSVECGHPGVRLNAETSQTGNNIELCCNKYTPNFHLKTISQCGFTSQPSWSCFNGHPRAQIYCTKVKLYRYQTVHAARVSHMHPRLTLSITSGSMLNSLTRVLMTASWPRKMQWCRAVRPFCTITSQNHTFN